MSPRPPDPIVAILGGGQLGRMLALAARRLGVGCRLLDPDPEAPARHVAETMTAPWNDRVALDRLAAGTTVATWEIEHVPLATVAHLAGRTPMLPPPQALAAVQDRAEQKQLLDELGLPTAPWAAPVSADGLHRSLARLGLPAVLKSRRGGYDGRGQRVVRRSAEIDAAWAALAPTGIIAEAFVPFDDECSLVAERDRAGGIRAWPLVENRHRDGVLMLTLAPHPGWTAALQAEAERIARTLLERLDYVGVLAVEFFRCGDRLLINELAPRVHNSGHWTLDGSTCDQFENHLRALLGRPLGATELVRPTAMRNCLGAMPGPAVDAVPGLVRHDYGKVPRPGRKVGHLNIVASDMAGRDARLAEVERLLAGGAADATG